MIYCFPSQTCSAHLSPLWTPAYPALRSHPFPVEATTALTDWVCLIPSGILFQPAVLTVLQKSLTTQQKWTLSVRVNDK